MKRIALISAIAISGLLFNNKADAQIRIRLGLNFAPRPVVYAAPASVAVNADYNEPANYDGDEDYYYLPEVDAYYSIPEQCYYYNDGSQWVTAAYLPGAYRNYDWRNAQKYEVRAPRPFMHDDYYRSRYNGVALNAQWGRSYDREYVNAYHADHDRSRGDERRFDSHSQGAENGQYERAEGQRIGNRVDQNRNFDRGGAQPHFAKNNFDRGDKDHRTGRF